MTPSPSKFGHALVCSALLCITLLVESKQLEGGHLRNLQQQASAQVADCGWFKGQKFCDLSKNLSAQLLSEVPTSQLKLTVEKVLVCAYLTEDETCDAEEHCRWEKETSTCRYKTDHNDVAHFERCIGDPVVFLEITQVFKVCKNVTPDPISCGVSPNCGWNSKTSTCEFDIWKFLAGIASEGLHRPVPKGVDQLMTSRLAILREAVKKQAVTRDDIENWDAPAFVCPSGVDMVTCLVAGVGDSLAKTQLYCEAGMVDGKCTPDGLCSSSCDASDAMIQRSGQAQTEVFLKFVEDPVAAAILEKHVQCLQKPEVDCTDEQDCHWDKETLICEAKPSFVMRTIAGAPLKENNIDCEVLRPMLSSGCLVKLETECNETPGCYWESGGDICTTTPGGIIQGLMSNIEGAESILKSAKAATDACSSKSDEKNCV